MCDPLSSRGAPTTGALATPLRKGAVMHDDPPAAEMQDIATSTLPLL